MAVVELGCFSQGIGEEVISQLEFFQAGRLRLHQGVKDWCSGQRTDDLAEVDF